MEHRVKNDIFTWDLCVLGPEGTVWEGGVLNVCAKFCDKYVTWLHNNNYLCTLQYNIYRIFVGCVFPWWCSYPFDPPVLSFTTRCFHPNISEYDGHIACHEATGASWSPADSVATLLKNIQGMLLTPTLKFQV